MGLNSFGLDAFYLCAQEKNFTRASERLNITQSALSQRIKNLEDELGVTLFFRNRIGVRLTEAGESLLRYCSTRHQLEEDLKENLNLSEPLEVSGLLRIGGFSTVMRSLVLPTCHHLVERHPQIHLSLISKEIFELPELLKSSVVDFILMDQPLEKEGLKSILLGQETYVRVRKKNKEFNERFLDHDEKDETTVKYLKLKPGAKIKRHGMDDIYGIIDGVQMGLGDALVPEHLLAHVKGVEVVDRKNKMRSPVYLIYYDHPIQSRLHKGFVEEIQSQAQKILGVR